MGHGAKKGFGGLFSSHPIPIAQETNSTAVGLVARDSLAITPRVGSGTDHDQFRFGFPTVAPEDKYHRPLQSQWQVRLGLNHGVAGAQAMASLERVISTTRSCPGNAARSDPGESRTTRCAV
jgi:hypothetical protein